MKEPNVVVIFQVFTAVKIQVEVLWAVTPCSVAAGFQCFRRTLLPPSSGWSYFTAWSCKTLASYRNTTGCHSLEDLNFTGNLFHNRKPRI